MVMKPRKSGARAANIGDIIEFKTPVGLAYVQYTHQFSPKQGELARVLPGLYASRPLDFAKLARPKELYFVFIILNRGLRTGAGQMEIVSNQAVPECATAPPLMRHTASFDQFGRTTRWRFISAGCGLTLPELQRAPLTFELTPEQKKLSIHQIRPAAAMLKELARGWTPERAEEFWLKDQAEAAVREKEKAASGAASEKGMQHYLYIPRKADAEEAGELLRRRGFSVEVRESRADENWLILATNAPPKSGEQMGELRDELESLAAQFGGEYDGWEAPLDS